MFFLYTNSKKTKTKESQSQNDDEWKNKTNIMRRGERRRATAVRTDVTAHTSFPSPPLTTTRLFFNGFERLDRLQTERKNIVINLSPPTLWPVAHFFS
jgi:hypothetical protein